MDEFSYNVRMRRHNLSDCLDSPKQQLSVFRSQSQNDSLMDRKRGVTCSVKDRVNIYEASQYSSKRASTESVDIPVIQKNTVQRRREELQKKFGGIQETSAAPVTPNQGRKELVNKKQKQWLEAIRKSSPKAPRNLFSSGLPSPRLLRRSDSTSTSETNDSYSFLSTSAPTEGSKSGRGYFFSFESSFLNDADSLSSDSLSSSGQKRPSIIDLRSSDIHPRRSDSGVFDEVEYKKKTRTLSLEEVMLTDQKQGSKKGLSWGKARTKSFHSSSQRRRSNPSSIETLSPAFPRRSTMQRNQSLRSSFPAAMRHTLRRIIDNRDKHVVFGTTLQLIGAREHNDGPPVFVIRCIEAIESKGGLTCPGIYRKQGLQTKIKELQDTVNQCSDYDLMDSQWGIHVLACALKRFFIELKDPLIPDSFREKLNNALDLEESSQISAVKGILKKLPIYNQMSLEFIIQHLYRISVHADDNQMDASRISLYFGPALVRHCETQWTSETFENDIISYLLKESRSLFPSRTVNPLFGTTLRIISSEEGSDGCPTFVRRCIEAIEERDGLNAMGIYRKEGSQSKIRILCNIITKGQEYNLMDPEWEIHILTNILKKFFRQLKEPLIPFIHYDGFIRLMTIGLSERIVIVRRLIASLPRCHQETLRLLMQHLTRVSENCVKTKMNSSNIAAMFGPNIIRCPFSSGLLMNLSSIEKENQIVEFLVKESRSIFR